MSDHKQLKFDTSGSARVGKGMQTRKGMTCGCGEIIVARKGLTGITKCTGCGARTKVRAH